MSSSQIISPRQVPGELLEKYQRPGPRYTSYPTAPHFTPQADFDAIEQRWKQGNEGEAPGLSLYTHIPFCRSRCNYCGCHTRVGCGESTVAGYVESLKAHADFLLGLVDGERAVGQMALGGGTPTFLSHDQMRDLVTFLQSLFHFPADGERSMEVDPRWVDEAYLDLLLELGFNRLSFGLQDLNPDVQEKINRHLPYEKIQRIMAYLRKQGLQALNLDLIYGLPGQTPQTFHTTVSQVIALAPTRIALFGYAHVPWVSPHQKKLEEFDLPSTEQRMELFGLAFEQLLGAGYRHVGMDHFARPEDELIQALDSRTLTRNFMGYTTRRGLDLVALGASGISSVSGTYAQNEKEIGDYSSAQGHRWLRGLIMSDDDVLRREVIMDLFCNFHLDIQGVEKRFGIDFADRFKSELVALGPFEDDGLIEVSVEQLVVTELGRFFIRNIAMTFDDYLQKESPSSQRYSKTL